MTPRHREIESHFRRLLAEHDLPQPDRVIDEPGSVGFVWEDVKSVVYVDFEEEAGAAA